MHWFHDLGEYLIKEINYISRREALKAFSSSALLMSLPLKGIGKSSSMITDFSASELSAMILAKKVSCEEVMHAYLAKIAAVNPLYNAIVSMPNEEILINQARTADIEL